MLAGYFLVMVLGRRVVFSRNEVVFLEENQWRPVKSIIEIISCMLLYSVVVCCKLKL